MRYSEVLEIRDKEKKKYIADLGQESRRAVYVRGFKYSSFIKNRMRKTNACFLILPIDPMLKSKPFSSVDSRLRVFIEDLKRDLLHLFKHILRVLISSGVLFVYGYVPLLPYVNEIFHEEFYFRYWIVIERHDLDKYDKPLLPVHEGLLMFIKKPYSMKNVNIVRSPHLRCEICGRMLRDWGGYKNRLNPYGYVIYDVWYEIPMYLPIVDKGFILFTKDVFDRIVSLVVKARATIPIIFPDTIYGVKILDDEYSPLKHLSIKAEEFLEQSAKGE